ncbi:MAG: trypsin-like peptidase domain-containing protein [Okeania sp. SIO3B5]|uniref:S1 family peptidase n=1 Tax=Okeania sp. SIO3B5 TaxID=2607811 RepID=UPI001401853F|nr:serine protease [Okeania sp. SIO3B5]NEO56591.1 trypsin-like peptidase domain-containing protein [Okeania sp. SIO3B5]
MKVNFSFKTVSILSIFLTILLLPVERAIAPTRHPILPEKIAAKQLCQTAAKFTVKIISGDSWGTGILVQKQGDIYTLVTNGHVLKDRAEKFIVETVDGQEYQASLLVNFHHGQITGNDLAILQFNSPKNYLIAGLAKWEKEERVMAVGFPTDVNITNSNNGGLTCTKLGDVSEYLAKPMQSGYQIGYKLTIFNGMSGGPLLSNRGQLVGIIGMGEPIIFVNPDIYLYKDGSRVTESLAVSSEEALDFLSSLSWAIPSETLVYLSPSGLELNLGSGK